MTKKRIPSPVKWIFTGFLAVFIPTYWIYYGPINFLWYSDILLFLTFYATVFESRLIASMAATGGFAFTSLWILGLVFSPFSGTTHYMFNSEYPLWVRGLSFFHVLLPFFYLWLIRKLGLDRRGWIYQSILCFVLAFTTWLVTDKADNINFVFEYERWNLGPFPYLIGGCLLLTSIIYLTHLFFKRWSPSK